jgi:Flp pilus assembly protein TadD
LMLNAQAQLRLGKYGKSIALLDQLIALSPDDPRLYTMRAMSNLGFGAFTIATTNIDQALALDPLYLPALLTRARIALLGDKPALTEQALAAVAAVDDENPQYLSMRGALENQRGNTRAAENYLKLAFDNNPGNTTLIALAQQKGRSGDAEGERNLYQQWLEDHPADSTIHGALGANYAAIGDVPRATSHLEQAIALNPDNWPPLNNLAWLLRERDPARARQYAEKAIVLSQNSADVLDTLALIQLQQGEIAQARESINAALSSAPENRQYQYHSAMIEIEGGNTALAREILKAILAQPGEFPEREATQVLYRTL